MSSPYPPFGGAPTQSCPRCGLSLPPNATFCGNCGYQMPSNKGVNPNAGPNGSVQPSPPTSWSGTPPQATPEQGQYRNAQWPQSLVGPVQNPSSLSGQDSNPAPAHTTLSAFAPNSPSMPGKLLSYAPNSPSMPGKLSAYAQNMPPASPQSQPQQPPFTQNVPPASPQSQPQQPPFAQNFASAPTQNSLSMPGMPPSLQPSSPNNYFSSPTQSMGAPNQFSGGAGYNAPGSAPSPVMAGSQPSYPMTNPGPQTSAPQNSGVRFEEHELEKKSRGSVGKVIGIVALLVVLIGGGFLAYTLYSSRNSSAVTPLTPTPIAVPTGAPLFTDAFKDNVNGWDLHSQQGAYMVSIGSGALTLEDDSNKLLPVFVPGGKTFNDFTLLVDAQLSSGDRANGYGIFIRGAANAKSALATYYRFELYGDGTYAIYKGLVDGNGQPSTTSLMDTTRNAAIQPQGGVNHIMVVAKGPSITFVVNGYTLNTFSDSSYASGLLALFVSNTPNAPSGAQAKFTNFGVYPAQT